MLKKRLIRLEAVSKEQNQIIDDTLYIVHKNEEKDRMTIPLLDYAGDIAEGQELMNSHPNKLFVITFMPDKNDH